MDKKHIIRGVIKFVGSICVGTTIDILVRQNTNLDKPFEKIAVGVGSGIIGMMVAETAESYLDKAFDEFDETIKKIKQPKQEHIPEETEEA